MSDRKREDEELRYIMQKRKAMKASKEARNKSLLAFQKGLKDLSTRPRKEQKRKKLGQRVIGGVATLAAASIAGLLILNLTVFQDDTQDEVPTHTLPEDGKGEIRAGESIDLQHIEENVELVKRVLERPTFDYDDLNAMNTTNIYNNTFSVHLPRNWFVEEEEGEDVHSVKINGPDSEQMNLLVFDIDAGEELIEEQIQKLTADFSQTAETIVPTNTLIEEMRMNFQISFPFDHVFPFDMENTRMYAFIDEESGRFMELYVSDLLGQPMIYTADFPLDNKESWFVSWLIFTYMRVQTPYTVPGSEGELHDEYQRPLEKTVLLQIGAFGFEEVQLELYENEEVGITSYLPPETTIERIEHDYFTEWRFSEPTVSADSFYSFGKLKDGFPLEQGKEIMFDAFNIDHAYHEDLGGGTPYHYAYYSGMDEEFIDGFIELFELSGEWFYKHKHADREDYNGGVFMQRLQTFIDSLEKH
ncbi:hypothetical protein [Halalkalibacter okhensis]|uniref:Uncharacterized protein n=1 Tax=Halalkalibacter okhensis TaxID=333138 RepID=A0A0B0IGV2_9BACI|nr:hypothetical protein [Halalkalibacter okhensis]KHF40540.1 hypothetical protein LQ50_08405 [Halalkalibacter okhensis]